MNSSLNPYAPVFVPYSVQETEQYEVEEQEVVSLCQSPPACSKQGLEVIPEEETEQELYTETNMSQAELEELEEVENWVNTMAWLEELEREHCIELALRLAPKQRVMQIEDKLGLWQISKTPTKRRGRRG
eukprot:TRINITY_DN74_c1_g2_i1.p3 TRINITY_DN74_c1_g2~~TRINITY_DN74_c1_g2_i1.p3  ORF type:complete len:130 (-),score=26.16 TRINITY_DN74_c1_g2_i1:216-605(-)